MSFMAEAKAVMGFMAMMVLIGAADVVVPSTDCKTEIASLVPCLNFAGGSDKKPSSVCCSAFANVVTTNASCLCLVLSGYSGFQVNRTKALTLPTACNVVTPPASNCNAAAAPGPSLVAGNPFSTPGTIGTVPAPIAGVNSDAGTVFAPSMVAIVSVATLVLTKILS